MSSTNVRTLADLGPAIRSRRKAAGLTLDEAAALLGVGRRFLIELERGERRASIETVLHVLHGLGLELRLDLRTPQSTATDNADDRRDSS